MLGLAEIVRYCFFCIYYIIRVENVKYKNNKVYTIEALVKILKCKILTKKGLLLFLLGLLK